MQHKFILFILFSLLFFLSSFYDVKAGLDGWQYSRNITINNTQNSNSLTDYQVLVTLDTQSLISAGKMKSDCGDIRFLDSDDSTELNYWIESGCNSANTKIWVKVPSIPASSTKTIYLYYGNLSASSTSDGEKTFEFFDDFDDGVFDMNKWGILEYGDLTESGGVLTLYWRIFIYSNSGYGTGTSLMYRGNHPYTYSSNWVGHSSYFSPPFVIVGRAPSLYYWGAHSYISGDTYTPLNPNILGSYHRYEITRNGTANIFYVDDLLNATHTTQVTTNSLRITLYTYSAPLYVDWIAVRKYTYPEPSVSVRTEETPPSTGTMLQTIEIEFEVQPIFLRGEGVYLSGNSYHITAYVQAYYPNLSYRKIGMDCYLNGDEFTATQNCSVQFYPEKGVCSILYPQYLSLTQPNEIKCKIYDPEYSVYTSTYVNKSFTPLNFSVWFSGYSTLVGEEFSLPVNIKNSGLFTDIYNLTAWIMEGEDLAKINPATKSFLIELNGDAFDPHFWNQTGPGTKEVYVKIIILDASSNLHACINTTSLLNQSYSIQNCIPLQARFKIMYELDLLQILFLVSIATIFIFKLKIKNKGSVV
ncbi:MAG: DUF2341 domain-containing protein [Candidatus Aenigmatarchaeota archaeon]